MRVARPKGLSDASHCKSKWFGDAEGTGDVFVLQNTLTVLYAEEDGLFVGPA
jgi:hypothetical protein